MIKISDVAKEAGVSISTVSNVINRKGTTKKETEALVLETIDRLGYIPNRMAQGLKSNRTNVIGIIEKISVPFLPEISLMESVPMQNHMIIQLLFVICV